MSDIQLSSKQRFLLEYAALCQKHGLVVSSCGCCDSPWVVPVGTGTPSYDPLLEHVKHLEDTE